MEKIKQNWYQRRGSKKAELWTLLHLPYSFMQLSFVIVGFTIKKPVNWDVMVAIVTAYFLGLQAAHFLDQLPSMGTRYVKHLTEMELLSLASACLAIAIATGAYYMLKLQAWHLLWLIPLQTFFAITYPASRLFKGFFHNDFWFSVSFGFIPVVVGYYMNNLSFSIVILPFATLCALISASEITLSRHVRKLRKELASGKLWLDRDFLVVPPEPEYAFHVLVRKPELALKLLCVLSYTLAISMVVV